MFEKIKLTVSDCRAIADSVMRTADAAIQSVKEHHDPMMDGKSAVLFLLYDRLRSKLNLENDMLKPIEGAKSHAEALELRIREIIEYFSDNPNDCSQCFKEVDVKVLNAKG